MHIVGRRLNPGSKSPENRQFVTANRRLQPLRYLHDCSDCFRLERLPGGACTHWKAPPCHGARQKAVISTAPQVATLCERKRRVPRSSLPIVARRGLRQWFAQWTNPCPCLGVLS